MKFRHGFLLHSHSVQRHFTCFGFIPSLLVASRFPCLAAIAQSAAVTAAKANNGNSSLRLPGMLSSASARQLHVHPCGGLGGLATDLSASGPDLITLLRR